MGVHTFVCRSSGGEWSAKALSGDLEASAASTFELQRRLVQAALAIDSSGGIQSSFSLVSPISAVFQHLEVVIIGGGGGGGFIGGGAATASAASGGGAAAAEAAAPAEEKKEEKEESDDDMGFSLFD